MLLICLLLLFLLACLFCLSGPIIIVENLDNMTTDNIIASSSTVNPSYSEYTDKCALLPQKNAANIEFLKEQMSKFTGIPEQVNALSTKVAALFAQQQSYANSLAGNEPPVSSNLVS